MQWVLIEFYIFFRYTIYTGNKELNLQPIDPLFLEKFSIVQNENSPVNIQLHFRNLTLNGIKDIVIYKVV